jgi:hypothetical protein
MTFGIRHTAKQCHSTQNIIQRGQTQVPTMTMVKVTVTKQGECIQIANPLKHVVYEQVESTQVMKSCNIHQRTINKN